MIPDPTNGHRRGGIPVSGSRWRDVRVRGEVLDGVVFRRCSFERVVLVHASLRGALLVECELNGLLLDGCDVTDLTLVECRGSGLEVSGGPFRSLVVTRCRLDTIGLGAEGDRFIVSEGDIGRLALGTGAERQRQLTVSGVEIDAFVAHGARWEQASLVGFDLTRLEAPQGRFGASSFIETRGDAADLSELAFARCNFFGSSLRGTRFRHARECMFAGCEMSDADLEGTDLEGAIFPEANLHGARMAKARINGALFPGAKLRGADLCDAAAARSVWTGADFRSACARRLDAPWGVFRNARMEGADFEGANLPHAELSGVDEVPGGAAPDHARRTTERQAERARSFARPEESC